MSPEQMALKIPATLRTEIVTMDMIKTAVPNKEQPAMKTLFHAWYTFVDPTAEHDIDCQLCLGEVIKKFEYLKPALVKMENESRILNQLI